MELIQVGDFINGVLITDIGKTLNGEKVFFSGTRGGWDEDYFNECFVESIVTKEQFKSMEYKVGVK